MLGQQEHAHLGPGRLEAPRRGRSFVGERRGHPEVEHDEVGLGGRHQFGQAVRVAGGADDFVALVGEQPHQPVPEQRLVLDHDHAHGSLAVKRVPVPGVESMVRLPPWARARSIRPSRPLPRRGVGAAGAVVAHGQHQLALLPGEPEDDPVRRRVLDRVGEALGGDEVRRRLELAGEPLRVLAHLDRDRATGPRAPAAPSPDPASSDAGRNPEASSRSSSMALPSSATAPSRVRSTSGGALPLRACWACRRSSPIETSRCWAPSWRSRARRRRSSSATATIRDREASSSSSRRRSSVCSAAISRASRPASRTSATSRASVVPVADEGDDLLPGVDGSDGSTLLGAKLPRAAVDVVGPPLGPEGHRQVLVVHGRAQRVLDAVGLCLAPPEPVHEVGHHPPRLVPRPSEPTVDGVLDPGAHRPERHRHHERPGRCGHRRGHESPDGEHHGRVRAAEHAGQRAVRDRPADDQVDVVELVPDDRDTDRDRQQRQGQRRRVVDRGPDGPQGGGHGEARGRARRPRAAPTSAAGAAHLASGGSAAAAPPRRPPGRRTMSVAPTANAGSTGSASVASGLTPPVRSSPRRGLSAQAGMASAAPADHTDRHPPPTRGRGIGRRGTAGTAG